VTPYTFVDKQWHFAEATDSTFKKEFTIP